MIIWSLLGTSIYILNILYLQCSIVAISFYFTHPLPLWFCFCPSVVVCCLLFVWTFFCHGILLFPSPLVLLQSLVLAALLYRALKPITFFMKLEERSRLRIVTLALQTTKAFNKYFKRASIAAVVVTISAALALINDIWPSLPPSMQALWDNVMKTSKEV